MRLNPRRAAFALATVSLLLLSVFGRQRFTAVSGGVGGAAGASCAAYSDGEAGMTRVPGATSETGTEQSDVTNLMLAFGVKRADVFAPESLRHAVTLDDFYLDRREVTNGQFKVPSLVQRLAEIGRGLRPGADGRAEYVFTGLSSGCRALAP